MSEANNTVLSPVSVAPMMDWTDRHCRFFHRLISPHALLYTEMVTTGAILHGDRDRFLRFHDQEHPVALQLGGSSPDQLAQCVEIADTYGYDEINLNCGCPSDRVQSGMFGAILMTKPERVRDCVTSMSHATRTPITVKCRIGVDEQDDFAFLDEFVNACVDGGCKTLIIHARKCWLKGLSPKENREIPELDYERVFAIKEKYPQLGIVLNGGITDIDSVQDHLKRFDGVMIGREAYQNPYFLAEIERKIFGNHQIMGREKIARAMMSYADEQWQRFDTPIKSITRHIMGLFHHQKGAKNWRRALSSYPYEDGANSNAIEKALKAIDAAHQVRIKA